MISHHARIFHGSGGYVLSAACELVLGPKLVLWEGMASSLCTEAFSKMCEHILAYGGCNSIASQRCIRVRRLAQILLEKTLNPNPDISWRGSAPIGVASSLRIL